MISLTLQLPFLFLILCSSAVLTEPPRSRSPSGLGVVGIIAPFLCGSIYSLSVRLFCLLAITAATSFNETPACQTMFIFYNHPANS